MWKLKKTNVKLLNYNGSKIKLVGLCNFKCRIKDKNVIYNVEFFVVDTNDNLSAILGFETCQKLNLIKRIEDIKTNKILNEYEDCFHGIGCMKNVQYKIKINKEAIPVSYTARNIPHAIKAEVKVELDAME